MRKVLILGATSAIAQESAKLFAKQGAALFLVARNPQRLQTVAKDLGVRGARAVETRVANLNDLAGHEAIVKEAVSRLGGLDAVLIAHGVLPNQAVAQRRVEEVVDVFVTNCTSVLSLVTHVSTLFEELGRGTIAVISSVAGDRARPDNYVYGTSKAAVSFFMEGLRVRLQGSPVRVVTIKPGPVDTPMTASIQKSRLFSDAATVGARVFKAMTGQGPEVVYAPAYWRWIMWIVRALPPRVIGKMKLEK